MGNKIFKFLVFAIFLSSSQSLYSLAQTNSCVIAFQNDVRPVPQIYQSLTPGNQTVFDAPNGYSSTGTRLPDGTLGTLYDAGLEITDHAPAEIKNLFHILRSQRLSFAVGEKRDARGQLVADEEGRSGDTIFMPFSAFESNESVIQYFARFYPLVEKADLSTLDPETQRIAKLLIEKQSIYFFSLPRSSYAAGVAVGDDAIGFSNRYKLELDILLHETTHITTNRKFRDTSTVIAIARGLFVRRIQGAKGFSTLHRLYQDRFSVDEVEARIRALAYIVNKNPNAMYGNIRLDKDTSDDAKRFIDLEVAQISQILLLPPDKLEIKKTRTAIEVSNSELGYVYEFRSLKDEASYLGIKTILQKRLDMLQSLENKRLDLTKRISN